MYLEILLQMEIWTWKKIEDVLVIDGKGGDEDDGAIDYIYSDDAVASKMAVDEQSQHLKNSNFSLCHNYSNSLLYGSCDEKRTL